MQLAPGVRVGPYEVVGPIGTGGMGEVYRAHDLRLGRYVALKVLPEHLASDSNALVRFEEEARAVATLSHPNILSIFEFDHFNELAIAVTELLEGETLAEALAGGPMRWRRVAEIVAGVAEGLHAAHARHIIHQDIKPQNIFLSSDGRIKILDFGLAIRRTADAVRPDEKTTPTDLASRMVVGSVGYMSPEQLRSAPVGPASDIFSLGCVAYEALTGKTPFARATPLETLAAVLHEDPAPIDDHVVPAAIADVVMRCLVKEPHRRIAAAEEVASVFRALLANNPSHSTAAPVRNARTIDSLAILPLANLTGDASNEYLADGLTDSIIHALSELPRVRIMARSTVFRFKHRDDDPLGAGRELHVAAVLTGAIAFHGDVLDVRLELVDVVDGACLWGGRVQKKIADVMSIQEEIAHEIADRLRVKLTGDEKRRLARRQTGDPEAFRLYLKGRFQWNKRSETSCRAAIDLFESSIERDPLFAMAYAGLADTYSIMANFGFLRPRDGYPRAKAAAERALEIDPDLAEAHAALAFVHDLYDYDATAAAREYREAIRMKPGYATARHWHAVFLSGQKRLDEAVAEMRRAWELDPLSAIINVELGLPYLHVRALDRAEAEFRRALETFDDFAPAHVFLGHALAQQERYDEAVRAYETANALGAGIDGRGWLGHAYARSGATARAERLLRELRERAESGFVNPAAIGFIELGLGELASAVESFASAFDDRTLYPQMMHDARLDPLRDDRRFAAIEVAVTKR